MNLLGDLLSEISELNKCDNSKVLVKLQLPKLGFYITKNPIVANFYMEVDLDLIKVYLLNKYKTKLLSGEKGDYVITNVDYIFKQDKVNNVDYYIYWEYNLINVTGFEIGTYFENLNLDVICVILSKLKYGNVLRTIYSDISDAQIFASNPPPRSLLNSFEDLKVRYKKHSNIFGYLDPIGLIYSLNVTNDDELFKLEKVYPYLKDKVLSTEISKLVGLGDENTYTESHSRPDIIAMGIQLHAIKLERKVHRKKLKYEYNDFYIYLTPKIMTLLNLIYEITDGSLKGKLRSFLDWEHLYKELKSFDMRAHLDNYRISRIAPLEKNNQFLSIILILKDIPGRIHLSQANPCLYVVCCLITKTTCNLYLSRMYRQFKVKYDYDNQLEF